MKVAVYTRVSTEEQVREGYSLEVQREYLESFAKREVRAFVYRKNLFNIFPERLGHGRCATRV